MLCNFLVPSIWLKDLANNFWFAAAIFENDELQASCMEWAQRIEYTTPN